MAGAKAYLQVELTVRATGPVATRAVISSDEYLETMGVGHGWARLLDMAGGNYDDARRSLRRHLKRHYLKSPTPIGWATRYLAHRKEL